MTFEELNQVAKDFNGGEEIGQTKLLSMFNIVKNFIEGMRDWRILLAEDSSNTASPSDTFLSMKTLPSDFRRPINGNRDDNHPLILRNGKDKLTFDPIPFTKRYENQENARHFYIDYKNNEFALTGGAGSLDKQYTIYLYYLAKTAELTLTGADFATEWAFPGHSHVLLPLLSVYIEKGQIDYDDINARMAPEHKELFDMILGGLIKDDDAIQRLELNI